MRSQTGDSSTVLCSLWLPGWMAGCCLPWFSVQCVTSSVRWLTVCEAEGQQQFSQLRRRQQPNCLSVCVLNCSLYSQQLELPFLCLLFLATALPITGDVLLLLLLPPLRFIALCCSGFCESTTLAAAAAAVFGEHSRERRRSCEAPCRQCHHFR